jgi:DNA-binding transcriptional MerR regulator
VKRDRHLSISKFAALARTTRDALLHYNKMGLLSPTARGDNKYRAYSVYQVGSVNMIRICQNLGMSLAEIKHLKDHRTPVNMDETLLQQIEKIDIKIDEWVQAKKLLLTLRNTINPLLNIDEEAITIQFMQKEAIVLGNINDYSQGRDDYDALADFYETMAKKYPELDMNYPVWALFSEERIKNGDWVWPDRFYFYNPEGYDKKPAALYVIGYTRGGYGQCDGLYKRLINFIDANGLEICGDAYEEYPLNEICISDENNYLIRLMITVREKKYGDMKY